MPLKTLRPLLAVLEQRSAMPPVKAAADFYTSPAWRALIERIIAARGRRCEDPACRRRRPATRVFGDHIVELIDGGAPLDERNIMLRCGSCHTRKTAEQRAARTRAIAPGNAPPARAPSRREWGHQIPSRPDGRANRANDHAGKNFGVIDFRENQS